jgi:subtilisin family serine protease
VRRGLVLAVLVATLVGVAPAQGAPARIAVGLAEGTSPDVAAATIVAVTQGVVDRGLLPLDALVVSVPDRDAAVEALEQVAGIEYVEVISKSRSLAFVPTDPLIPLQWYLPAVRAFDYWPERPPLDPVRVAVIDSGIDAGHPEFVNRVVASRSFVPGPPTTDSVGHGTMVAGEIGAAIDNAEGIAGLGFPVELVIAKVVGPDGNISVEAEAKAIRWAVDQGARVVNLSLGGPRDPRNPAVDTYSALEQAAVDYAYRKGAVIVAATGNCQQSCPYFYASYPAALPHVIGVSALRREGTVPVFSNRDAVFNDIASPGAGIVSTIPLTLSEPGCHPRGYSPCAGDALRNGNGTSFAAPLVSAAAALLLALRPELHPSQVMTLLERSADDILNPGRDLVSGNGQLDVYSALTLLTGSPVPPADRYETNDDAGDDAFTLYGSRRSVEATIDPFDDPSDVYRVSLRAGQRLFLNLKGPARTRPTLVVWRPGTKHVTAVTQLAIRTGAVVAYETAGNPRVAYRAPRGGSYYVEVKAARRAGGQYVLSLSKR